ncbi:MAG TPA: acyl-CoA synthetase, partial [Mycobacterium sp.]|nr:acyl-CoA synthetase [Mycobacterium sp.]
KTARTFPVIEGIRHSVPGDRARWYADGQIELLGRDAVTINSGGEKIFAEEVEAAIAKHPAVYDVVVTGRPSTRWGSEVVAIVQLVDGEQALQEGLADSIIAEAARHLARYKLPKEIVFCDRVQRSPSGKADYRWAKAQVTQPI